MTPACAPTAKTSTPCVPTDVLDDTGQPTRLTRGGGALTDTAAYNSGGADWSHSKKLIAFQSNREGLVPQIYLMNPDGSDQQPLVRLAERRRLPELLAERQ